MAVTVTKFSTKERGIGYNIAMSAANDVCQARLNSMDDYSLNWFAGDVSWYVSAAAVTVTFTNVGDSAFAVDSGGDSTTTGWLAHPDDAEQASAETLPISGLRFKASAADQSVVLWTRVSLVEAPKSVSGV